MKILLVGPAMGLPIPPNGWGGIEKVIWKHACELRKRGHEVTIFNERDEAKLFDSCKQQDVIHVHQEWCFAGLKTRGIPFIFTSHMSSWQRNWNMVEPLLKNCTMAMPFEKMSEKMRSLWPPNQYHDWAIWNGADPLVFHPGVKEPGMSIAVGKDEPRKNFSKVIDLFYCTRGMTLALVGPGNDKYKDKPGIVVYPNLSEPEVAALMGRADTFYHLADEEADCLVVREAAMSGCKLVLSEYCKETIGDRKPADYTWEKVVDNLEEGYRCYLRELR